MSRHSSEATEAKPSSYPDAGKRRAENRDGRGNEATSRRLFRLQPAAVLVGLASIVVAATGAIASEPLQLANDGATPASSATQQVNDSALIRRRTLVVSRSAPLQEAAPTGAVETAVKRREQALSQIEAAVKRREQALSQIEAAAERHEQTIRDRAAAAEERRRELESRRWVLPMASYRLTGLFGQASYLWSTVHTGLDFAAPDGTSIYSVAAGTVTETGYAGSYGYRTLVTHADGTEVWYGHQSSIGVSVGESVGRGEVIGQVGSTGNVTGPHLHLEVRPAGGSPVDPYAALVARGAQP